MSTGSTPSSPVARLPSNGRTSCFRSFVIYNPTLSGGKEERAHENNIFFYPHSVDSNRQMNHVGLCTAVMCIVERFQPTLYSYEIRTDERCITVFSPRKNLYMALEADELYDAAVCSVLIRKAYIAFVLRHGVRCFDTFSRGGGSEVAIRTFFDDFCHLMESYVMHVHSSAAGGKPHTLFPTPSPRASVEPFPLASVDGGVGDRSSSNESTPLGAGSRRSAPMCDGGRWLSRALAESLLHTPLRLQLSTTSQHTICNSIVAQHLSLLTASARAPDRAFRRQWTNEDDEQHHSESEADAECGKDRSPSASPLSVAPVEERRQHSLVFGTLSPSQSASNRTRCHSPPPGTAGSSTGRTAWTTTRCLILTRDDRHVVYASCDAFLAVHLTYLSMIDTNLSSFVLHHGSPAEVPTTWCGSTKNWPPLSEENHQPQEETNNNYFCCVHLGPDLIVYLIVDSIVLDHTSAFLNQAAAQLAFDVSEWLRTGSCSILRESPIPTFTVVDSGRKYGSELLKSSAPFGSLGGATSESSSGGAVPGTQSTLSALRSGSSWVCWSAGMIHGALLSTYPRLVQWTLGNLMREAIGGWRLDAAEESPEVSVWRSSLVLANAGSQEDDVLASVLFPSASNMYDEAPAQPLSPAQRRKLMATMRRSNPGELQKKLQKMWDDCRPSPTAPIEVWMPLGADGWLFVSHRSGRVVGIPFHGPPAGGLPYLLDCFSVAEKLTAQLFHGSHLLAGYESISVDALSSRRQ